MCVNNMTACVNNVDTCYTLICYLFLFLSLWSCVLALCGEERENDSYTTLSVYKSDWQPVSACVRLKCLSQVWRERKKGKKCLHASCSLSSFLSRSHSLQLLQHIEGASHSCSLLLSARLLFSPFCSCLHFLAVVTQCTRQHTRESSS